MTAIVQHFFSSPETMLSGKKIVILVLGYPDFHGSINFNNIRKMDNQAKLLHGKRIVDTVSVRSNITEDTCTFYPNLLSPNFIKIPTEGRIVLYDKTLKTNQENNQIIVAIPTCLKSGSNVNYFINDNLVDIPECYVKYRHMNVICELPAGTDHLKVEVIGKPGTVLSIKDIQIYQ